MSVSVVGRFMLRETRHLNIYIPDGLLMQDGNGIFNLLLGRGGEYMKSSFTNSMAMGKRLSGKGLRRLRNAVARRKLQDMQDEKVLQSLLAEVWD